MAPRREGLEALLLACGLDDQRPLRSLRPRAFVLVLRAAARAPREGGDALKGKMRRGGRAQQRCRRSACNSGREDGGDARRGGCLGAGVHLSEVFRLPRPLPGPLPRPRGLPRPASDPPLRDRRPRPRACAGKESSAPRGAMLRYRHTTQTRGLLGNAGHASSLDSLSSSLGSSSSSYCSRRLR